MESDIKKILSDSLQAREEVIDASRDAESAKLDFNRWLKSHKYWKEFLASLQHYDNNIDIERLDGVERRVLELAFESDMNGVHDHTVCIKFSTHVNGFKEEWVTRYFSDKMLDRVDEIGLEYLKKRIPDAIKRINDKIGDLEKEKSVLEEKIKELEELK